MPNLQSIQSILQAGDYTFSGYLCVPPETVVFSRAVNMPAGIPDKALTLTFDNPYSGVGAYTDVEVGMEVIIRIGNTSAIRGRLRVAAGGSTSTVLQVDEFSAGRIAVQDNDRIDVIESFRLRHALVAQSSDFNKDSRIPYTDQGANHPPSLVTGCGAAGFVNPATGLLTVVFDFSLSVPTDLDSSSPLTFVSDVGDGTITVGTSTSTAFTATFPVGVRHVRVACTDVNSGKTSLRKIPVWAFDGVTYSPIPVKNATLSGARLNGWNASFELLSNCDLSVIPEGSPLYYFEREWYGGVEVSYGNAVAARSNIKFVGFGRRETITLNPDNDTLTLEAISPLQKMAELMGLSQALATKIPPNSWQTDETLTLFTLIFYLFYWHSTANLLFDLIWDVNYPYVYPAFYLQQATLLAQAQEVTAGISCIFACDRTGRFSVTRNLQRGTSSERNAAAVTFDLTARDLKEIPSLVYEHGLRYAQLVGKFFSSSGEPMLSVAPGEAPAEGPELTSFERGIAISQSEANWITSQAWAELNGLYNGLPVPVGASFKPKSSYDVVDPAYAEWLTLTLAGSTNRRGRAFTNDRFILQKVDITCDSETGTKDITWTVDHETMGQGSVTRQVETEVDLPPSNPDPPSPWVPPPVSITMPPWGGVDTLPTELIVFAHNAAYCHIATAWNPASSSLVYTDRSTGLTGTNIWACADPYNYGRYFALQTTGLYRNDDPFGGGTWTLVADNSVMLGNATYVGKYIQMSINRRGYIAVCSGSSGFAYSFDYGVTWNQVSIDGIHGTGGTSITTNQCTFEISPFNSPSDGRIFALVFAANFTIWRLYRSDNWGATWTAVGVNINLGGAVGVGLNIPYKRPGGVVDNVNDANQVLYAASGQGHSINGGSFQQSVNAGVTFTVKKSYANGSRPPAGAYTGRSLQTFTYDGSIVMFANCGTGAGNDNSGASFSIDEGVTLYSSNALTSGNNKHWMHVNGYSIHSGAVLAFNNLYAFLNWTINGGINWSGLVALPAGYTGASYCEWSLRGVV